MVPAHVDASDENVVVVQLLFVATKELLVELEGSAPVGSNLEVSHLFSSFTELLGIFDLDNTRVEWSGEISSDLRLVSKCDFALFLKD